MLPSRITCRVVFVGVVPRCVDAFGSKESYGSTSLCFVVCETSNKHCAELLHVCWIAGRSADDNDDDD